MSALSNYLENSIVDWLLRGQAFTPPATVYVALLTCTKGVRANSAAYALNDTLVLTANDGKLHYYKCTTAGTTAAAQSTLYPGAFNEVITDGTAVMTEQNAGLEAGTAQVEVTGGSYARVAVSSSLANWAGTQAAASTVASTGVNGTTSNNGAITFPAPTANWASGSMQVWGITLYDAASAGNPIMYSALAAPKTINSGDPAPLISAAQLAFQIDN
jgi:hypothetical protein